MFYRQLSNIPPEKCQEPSTYLIEDLFGRARTCSRSKQDQHRLWKRLKIVVSVYRRVVVDCNFSKYLDKQVSLEQIVCLPRGNYYLC